MDKDYDYGAYNQKSRSPTATIGGSASAEWHSILGIPQKTSDSRAVIITNHAAVYPEFLVKFTQKASN